MIDRRAGSSFAILLAIAAFVAFGMAFALSADSGDAATRNYIQVSAREYYYGLSKTRVKPGTTTFEMINYGEDDHDLAVRRKGSSTVRKMEDVRPGERGRMTTKLRRGTYVLWCTITDHRARGMSATLKVRP